MYKTILVTLDGTSSDRAIIEHVKQLAKLAQSRVVLLHVADGWASELAFGDPSREIVRWVKEKGCDLIAMSTHGHKFLADIFLGTTANRVQHAVSVPVLLLRAK
jgi:nucleotide-binding universal stress UspA family protein